MLLLLSFFRVGGLPVHMTHASASVQGSSAFRLCNAEMTLNRTVAALARLEFNSQSHTLAPAPSTTY